MPKKKKHIDHNNLDFFGHLEVFRWKIISIIVMLLVAMVASFVFIDKVIYFLKIPVMHIPVELIYVRPQEKFVTYIKIAFFSGLFATVPLAVIQAGSFIFPAMHKKERPFFISVVIFIILFFFAGSAFSYFFLTPTVFNFFTNFAKDDGVKALWSVNEYFNMLILIIFMMGLLFQTPWVIMTLIKLKIVKLETLVKFRRHIIIGILIVAAVVTPTVDLYTQGIVALVLYLLFEFTVLFARIFMREKKKK
ncbi:MAG: twin-arginine translocase subunit TatC [Spirochaetes bacterium]|nr:twin-arginine translocase subunit TatC [Spirochaetota bacterium]